MPLTKELRTLRNQQIISLYVIGHTTTQLAVEFSLNDSQIYLIVRKAGVIRSQKRVSDEQKTDIVSAYSLGKSTTEIAAEFNICQVTVQNIIKASQGKLRRKVLSFSERQAVVDAYLTIKSSIKVAKQFGISKPTVLSICQQAGVETVNRLNVSRHLSSDLILAEYKTGATTIELGRNYGVGHYIISRLLNKAGIRPSDSSNTTESQRQARKKRYALHALRQRGENSHRWKGGRTNLRALIRPSAKYKAWRLAVFQRDNFTCQNCGCKNSSIQADHIYPFSWILDDHQITTLEQADECASLWNVGNGRTLCKPCHEKTDTYLNGAKYR